MSIEKPVFPDAGLFPRFVAGLMDASVLFVVERLITVGLVEPQIETSIGIWLTKFYFGYFEGAQLDRAVMFADLFGYAWPALIFALLYGLYFPLFEASPYQGTFGKIIVGLKVTGKNGTRVSFYKTLIRNLLKIASLAPVGIGVLLIATTERKQALHDLFAKTYVSKRSDYSISRALLAIPFTGIVLLGGYFALDADFQKLISGIDSSESRKRELQRISSNYAVVQESFHSGANTLFGSFAGRSFAPKSITYEAGVVRFLEEHSSNNSRVIEILLKTKPRSLSEKRFEGSGPTSPFIITTVERPPGKKSAVRKSYPKSAVSMNLMFGSVSNGKLPGAIDLKLTDKYGGHLRGSFSIPIEKSN